MEVKPEQNMIGNVPASRSTLSIKSIVKDFQKSIKDLQDLDKSLILKSELEAMKQKQKKLEEENSSLKTNLLDHLALSQKLRDENERLKAEFEATERDKMVYYNQYHRNGKEVGELKAEVERLKNQNQALKDENEYLKEIEPLPALIENKTEGQEERITDRSSSSIITPAVPIDDSESDVDEVINNSRAEFAVSGKEIEIVSIESQCDAKRPRLELSGTESDVEKKWKCMLCKTLRFKTLEDVRSHTKTSHPERIHFCNKCPYATNDRCNIKKHLRQHETNEMKYKGSESAGFCSLCDVTFKGVSWLLRHNDFFH